MKDKRLMGVFSGRDRERIEDIARDMGMPPEETVVALILEELERDPTLGLQESPKEALSGTTEKPYRFTRSRPAQALPKRLP